MKQIATGLVALVIAGTLLPTAAAACSATVPLPVGATPQLTATISEAARDVDVVFQGHVLRLQNDAVSAPYAVFSVETLWKGPRQREFTISLGSCDNLPTLFGGADSYIVYARFVGGDLYRMYSHRVSGQDQEYTFLGPGIPADALVSSASTVAPSPGPRPVAARTGHDSTSGLVYIAIVFAIAALVLGVVAISRIGLRSSNENDA